MNIYKKSFIKLFQDGGYHEICGSAEIVDPETPGVNFIKLFSFVTDDEA